MVFASASLARRIERAEATLIAEFGRIASGGRPDEVAIRHLAGGIAVVAGAGAPFSKIAGLGFEPLEPSDLDSIEQAYAQAKTPVRVEISSLARNEIGELLTRRGYALVGFENVLASALSTAEVQAGDISISIERIVDTKSAEWVDVLASSFAVPDKFDGPSLEETVDRAALDVLFDQIAGIGGFVRYFARCDGEAAGAAGMRIADGVAQLCGAGTLPAHRRRGVQTALLNYRLADAARAGCDIAVVTTQPGSVSQQNVQRQGFELLYSRAILVKAHPSAP
jgi:ribosomal protein S18 acetylase RimI-like enzyme